MYRSCKHAKREKYICIKIRNLNNNISSHSFGTKVKLNVEKIEEIDVLIKYLSILFFIKYLFEIFMVNYCKKI